MIKYVFLCMGNFFYWIRLLCLDFGKLPCFHVLTHIWSYKTDKGLIFYPNITTSTDLQTFRDLQHGHGMDAPVSDTKKSSTEKHQCLHFHQPQFTQHDREPENANLHQTKERQSQHNKVQKPCRIHKWDHTSFQVGCKLPIGYKRSRFPSSRSFEVQTSLNT